MISKNINSFHLILFRKYSTGFNVSKYEFVFQKRKFLVGIINNKGFFGCPENVFAVKKTKKRLYFLYIKEPTVCYKYCFSDLF